MAKLDKYAKDAGAWRTWAKIDYGAAQALFSSKNPALYIPAATLGHHALEMYLKAALIHAGMTVFKATPKTLSSLGPALGLTAADCVWGHGLVDLGKQLSLKRQDFDLAGSLGIPDSEVMTMPKTLQAGLELFDPFFSELRYPQELTDKIEGVGDEEKLILDRLVELIAPFSG